MKLVLAAIAAGMLLAGCAATPTRATLGVHDADAAMVKSCTFVGTVIGHSKLAGLFSATGEQNAQNDARAKAAAQGANRIVWKNLSASYWATPNVNGDAYRCDAVARNP